jgi:two-component system chemotaxis response regulator CheB
MQPVRILIVDDSAVIRRLLGDLLASEPEIVVAGTAANGSQALARIPEVSNPGCAGARRERLCHKTLPSETPERSHERVREEFLRKIKSLCAVRQPRQGPGPMPVPIPILVSDASACPQARIDVVAIGASTGGPNALTELIPEFPADFPVPIVIVQHMPALFTQLLAERLNTLSALEVQEGKAGQKLQRGQVWVAPGDHHMTVARKGTDFVLGINHDPAENSCRPAVDVLFRSLAQTYGANVLAVVLTGMGTDGTRGSAVIREAGGEVIVQDEASSVVWGMPGSVVLAGLADRVYPLAGIGPEVVRRVSVRRALATAGHP